jgi:hypothetical protein
MRPLLAPDQVDRAGRLLTSYIDTRSQPAITFAEIHKIRGVPPAARAAIHAADQGESWVAVGRVLRRTLDADGRRATSSSWNTFRHLCTSCNLQPIPVTTAAIAALWSQRVIGRGLKSSGLQSLTSRILTHARLLGHPADTATLAEIAALLPNFCKTFPCGVKPAAPPFGVIHGLDKAIAYATARANTSRFYRLMAALLLLEQTLYCRPSALLEGNLCRRHLTFMPASATQQGGLVANLMLPKRRKGKADSRLDSHPVPMGPAVQALLSLMDSLDLLRPDSDPNAIIFPDIDPETDKTVGSALSVRRSTALLRRYVFTPAGISLGEQLTLRGIRSGASTDAHIKGVSTTARLAQGGWASVKGASTYLDLALASLSAPPLAHNAPLTTQQPGANIISTARQHRPQRGRIELAHAGEGKQPALRGLLDGGYPASGSGSNGAGVSKVPGQFPQALPPSRGLA